MYTVFTVEIQQGSGCAKRAAVWLFGHVTAPPAIWARRAVGLL